LSKIKVNLFFVAGYSPAGGQVNTCLQQAGNNVICNFMRMHKDLRATPTRGAGLINNFWTWEMF
jgi:hypothetical protein